MAKKAFSFKKSLRVLSFAKPHKLLISVVFMLSFVLALLGLVTPYLIKILIDDVLINKNLIKFIYVIYTLLGVFAFKILLDAGRSYWYTKLSEYIALDVKLKLFKHIVDLQLNFFHSKESGDIISRLLDDVYGIQEYIDLFFNTLIMNVLTAGAILTVALYLDWKITLISLTIFPLYLVVVKQYASKIKRQQQKLRKKSAELLTFLQEGISMIDIVKAFGREKKELDDYEKKQKELIRMSLKMNILENFSSLDVTVISFLPAFVVLLLGGYNVIQGILTIGTLIALYTYISNLFGPISTLGSFKLQLQGVMVSVDRVFEFLDMRPKIVEKKDAKDIRKCKGHIKFENVSFVYEDSNQKVLDKVSLEIKPGEHVAIVGPSGVGKSTIGRLILRFYDPQGGKILVDGKDLRDLKLRAIKRHLGMVSQESQLFNTSIKENIRFGKLDASDREIVKSAKLANIHDVVASLPKKYDTKVGTSGSNLSGGQKQRVCIARTMLHNPSVIILDEATSALDPESEKWVNEAIEKVTKGKTTINITHKLTGLQKMDRILVLENGKFVEDGTFKQLLKKKGEFYRLYKVQEKESKG